MSASSMTIEPPGADDSTSRRERQGTSVERHDAALDGLRGLAILGVILCHASEQIPFPLRSLHAEAYYWLQAGCYGVDAFFVLSGFLITGILVDARGNGPQPRPRYFSAFYARRVLRIFPLYYAFLIGALWCARIATPHGAWGFWIYLANVMWVIAGAPPAALAPLWSLSVEEQFYFVWPLVLAWGARRRRIALCVGVTIASWVLAVVMTATGAGVAVLLLTPTRAYSLGLGAFVAVGLRDPRWRGRITAFAGSIGGCAATLLGILISITPVIHIGDWLFVVQSSLTTLLTAACIAVSVRGDATSWLRGALSWPPFVSLGVYSYAMYVLHMPIAIGMGRLVPELRPAGVLVGSLLTIGSILALSWAAAYVSRRVIEQPFLSLKRFVPMPGGRTERAAQIIVG
jgi:peptidoglycan/LPS O-acetylase OafA/YrhL